MQKHYRHGDVFLIATNDQVPLDAKKQARCVLAEGEVTGHLHEIANGAVLFVDVDGEKWIDVLEDGAVLMHPEHGPIKLDAGRYRMGIEREYTPEAIRPALD